MAGANTTMKLDHEDILTIAKALQLWYESGQYNEREGECLTHALNRFRTRLGSMNFDARKAGTPTYTL